MHASLSAAAPITDAVLAQASADFRPEDEFLCIWIQEKDPRTLVVSYDLTAHSYEEAARRCKAHVAQIFDPRHPEWHISQVGATNDDGYLLSDDPASDFPT